MLRLLLLLCVTTACRAALVAQPLTPLNTSVLGGESQVYSVRFLDAAGQPSVGERVAFDNDACGFFDNGGFATNVVTDAQGVASARFTARAQGITCWITAQAGASARFNVFTYTLGQVAIVGSLFPAEPRPGEMLAINAGAYAGSYPIYNADLTARVVPGSGTAALSAAGANSGQAGRVTFGVTPQGAIGGYEIEVGFRGITRRFPVRAPASPLQDLWWGGPAENGWGVSVVQHGEQLFAVVYAYDAAGAPAWYVMPGGTWNAARTAFTGALYAPRGTPWSSYDASKLAVGAAAGEATLRFDGANAAVLEYAIGDSTGRRPLSRQPFGPAEATPAPVQASDMWWGGAAQNGWGLAVLQQHRTLFAAWFTYGADGAPTWFVMPAGYWSDASTWEGRIYRTTGAPWHPGPYDASRLASVDVGAFALRFDGNDATFTYTIEGKTGTMALMRQAF